MIEFIFMNQVAKELGCKDYRTVKDWCKKKGVGILKITGSKRSYLIKEEFEAIKNKEAIDYLREKYGEGKILKVINSSAAFSPKDSCAEKVNEYLAQGEHEKNFLNRLQNLNRTL